MIWVLIVVVVFNAPCFFFFNVLKALLSRVQIKLHLLPCLLFSHPIVLYTEKS